MNTQHTIAISAARSESTPEGRTQTNPDGSGVTNARKPECLRRPFFLPFVCFSTGSICVGVGAWAQLDQHFRSLRHDTLLRGLQQRPPRPRDLMMALRGSMHRVRQTDGCDVEQVSSQSKRSFRSMMLAKQKNCRIGAAPLAQGQVSHLTTNTKALLPTTACEIWKRQPLEWVLRERLRVEDLHHAHRGKGMRVEQLSLCLRLHSFPQRRSAMEMRVA